MNDSLSANGSKGHHTFTLEIIETTDENSASTNTSYISYTFKISASVWYWEGWGNNITYSVTIGDNTYYGSIPNYNGNATVLQSNTNIPIVHNADGTKTINIAFNVVDNANQSYTCGNASANKNVTLTPLHKAPENQSVSVTETDPTILTYNLDNGIMVSRLSKLQINAPFTYYDNASLDHYEIVKGNDVLMTSQTNNFILNTWDLSNYVETETHDNVEHKVFKFTIKVVDTLGGVGTADYVMDVIDYKPPAYYKSQSSVKRKTTGGTSLIDNIVVVNFTSVYYAESTYVVYYTNNLTPLTKTNPIGTSNTITLTYKLWLTTSTEPPTETPLATTAVVQNYEINNVNYEKTYFFKIYVKDSFKTGTITYTIPTGVSVWNEYKDRVDFLNLTIKNNPIMEKVTGTDGFAMKFYNGLMICLGFMQTGDITWTNDNGHWYAQNFTFQDFPAEFTGVPYIFKTISSQNYTGGGAEYRFVNLTSIKQASKSNPGTFNLDTEWNATPTNLTVEYIAIGWWK